MKILLSDHALLDLEAGFFFYESQGRGVGRYFISSLTSDIDSLLISAGTHRVVYGYNRALSKRFPFAIYYRVEDDTIRIRRVLDCRRNPTWIRRNVKSS